MGRLIMVDDMSARIIAVANQKGGVAKTTTVHSLGAALSERSRSVLLVDLDPQACLTFSAGFDPDTLSCTIHDVLAHGADMEAAVLKAPNFDLLPANIDLAASEVHLLARTGREHVLSRALAKVSHQYDYVLVDCPPSLGVLTINGLACAHEVLIPLQCEALSHRGVGQLLDTVEEVKSLANPGLSVRGLIATMYDERTRHSRQVLEDVASRYGIAVLVPPVRKSIRFAEAPAQGRSILEHAPHSPGAEAYRELAAVLDGDLR